MHDTSLPLAARRSLGAALTVLAGLLATPAHALPMDAGTTLEVALEQPVQVKPGDSLSLRGGHFTVRYDGTFSRTECATPTNCGAGYNPRAQFTITRCDGKAANDCPFLAEHKGNSGTDYQTIQAAIVPRAPREPSTLAGCRKLAGDAERDACLASVSRLATERDGQVCELISNASTVAREECFVRVAARRDDDKLCLKIAAPDKRITCIGNVLFKVNDLRTCEGIIETAFPFELHNLRTRGGCVSAVIETVRKNTPTSPQECAALKDVTTREFCLAFTMQPGGDRAVCAQISPGNTIARSYCLAHLFSGKSVTEAQCHEISDVLLYRKCCTQVKDATGKAGCAAPNP